MVEQHIESGAGVTVAGIRVPAPQGTQFGVIETAPDGRTIAGFLEKPADPPSIPDSADQCYASMGNYVFSTETLLEALRLDAGDEGSVHDMGGNIIPMLVDAGPRARLRLRRATRCPARPSATAATGATSGRSTRTTTRTWTSSRVHPIFNLYNRQLADPDPDAVAAAGQVRRGRRRARVDGRQRVDRVRRPRALERAVATTSSSTRARTSRARCSCPACAIGRGAVVRRAILDKNVIVPEGAQIGVNPTADRERYTMSPGGIVVLGKGQKVEPA